MAMDGGAGAKLLYIVVDDVSDENGTGFRYTRSVLQSTLQFMGCKARHAFKVQHFFFLLFFSFLGFFCFMYDG